MKPVTLNSRVGLRGDLDTMEVDDAIIVANRSGGDCYGLDLIAGHIWRLLHRRATVAELCEILLAEYDIDRETCEREVLEFLNDSTREGLIQADE